MKTSLQLYDTRLRKKAFISASNETEVRIYCCGPTVYRNAHVGNLRTFLLSDLVIRILHARGVNTKLVQNITDVGHMSEDVGDDLVQESSEDKVLAQAESENRDPFAIAREYEQGYHQDLRSLNISVADNYPRASECIDLMQNLIEQLIEKGKAYQGGDGTVYFDAQTFSTYGEISGNRLDQLKPGHRFDYHDDGVKKFHADWALWKSAGGRTQMVWPSPWGIGFPGWHIECSAMSLAFLDGHVDLHLGGMDLRFPHHENERAQSNSVVEEEAVDNWVHGEHLLFEGRKMSKSTGNVVLVRDVAAKNLDPLSLRLCFLENRYRSQMDLTWEAIVAANTTIHRWREKMHSWENDGELDEGAVAAETEIILSAVEDDLDTLKAIQRIRFLERETTISPKTKHQIFIRADLILGLDLDRRISRDLTLPPEAERLLEERQIARLSKDFHNSDLLRDRLLELGVVVKDTQTGQVWEILD